MSRILNGYVVGVRLFPLSSLPVAEQDFFGSRGIGDPKTLFYAISLEL
jgi:hypothetical protein